MAQNLNKSRIRYTQMGLLSLVLATMVTAPTFAEGGLVNVVLDMLGGVLVGFCTLGRLYSTAFLGGYKNEALITIGPFSVVRNPLYLCSFIGVCGLAIISNHLILMVIVPAVFLYIYVSLIKREEVFLLERFGDTYREYCEHTPRLFPRITNYQSPESVPMQPRFMLFALRDSLFWLSIVPFFEIMEELQEQRLIPVLWSLP